MTTESKPKSEDDQITDGLLKRWPMPAPGTLMTMIDCKKCGASFLAPGKKDDVIVQCEGCGVNLLVRLES